MEQILAELGDHRAARLSYSERILEIMVPMAAHEDDKRIIGRLIEIIDISTVSRQFPNLALLEAIPRYVPESKQFGCKKIMKDFREWVKNSLNHA